MFSLPLVKAENGKPIRYIVQTARYRPPNGFALRMSKPTVRVVSVIYIDLKRRASTCDRLLLPTTAPEAAKKDYTIMNPSLTIASSASSLSVYTALQIATIRAAMDQGIKQC